MLESRVSTETLTALSLMLAGASSLNPASSREGCRVFATGCGCRPGLLACKEKSQENSQEEGCLMFFTVLHLPNLN